MARPRRRVRKPGLCAAAVLLGLLVVTILAAVTTVQSEPDIPFDRYGHVLFTQGSSGAATKVEVYLDLACSDCARTWPILSQVVEAYGHQAEFLYRLFPLPYHRNAFTAAKAAKVVRLYSNSNDETGSFLTAVFEGQDRISNDATEDMTQYEIEAVLAEWVTSTTGVSMDAFNTGMSDDDVEAQSRIQFKYGCLHGVFGTPQVFVGGVWAENLDGEETFQDWQDLLEPLVGGVAATAEMNGRTTMSVV
eukprot:g6638.t1